MFICGVFMDFIADYLLGSPGKFGRNTIGQYSRITRDFDTTYHPKP
jgi:hypothetical protein